MVPLHYVRIAELVQATSSLAFAAAVTCAGANAAIRNDAKLGKTNPRPAYFVHH